MVKFRTIHYVLWSLVSFWEYFLEVIFMDSYQYIRRRYVQGRVLIRLFSLLSPLFDRFSGWVGSQWSHHWHILARVCLNAPLSHNISCSFLLPQRVLAEGPSSYSIFPSASPKHWDQSCLWRLRNAIQFNRLGPGHLTRPCAGFQRYGGIGNDHGSPGCHCQAGETDQQTNL